MPGSRPPPAPRSEPGDPVAYRHRSAPELHRRRRQPGGHDHGLQHLGEASAGVELVDEGDPLLPGREVRRATAAVVGVVLNLAVWFAINALFPNRAAVDWFAVIVSAIAFIAMLRWKWEIVPVVLGSGVLGMIYKFLLTW